MPCVRISPDAERSRSGGLWPANPVKDARMLQESSRTNDYIAAIAAAVQPGDVVLDVGTGSGVLAVAAARAGARRVYAVEANGSAEVAERAFVSNGVRDRVTLVRGRPREVELPERADVLVAEVIGSEPLAEEILETTLDARRRLLKPGARLVPNALALLMRPLQIPWAEARLHAMSRRDVERWHRLYGIDLRRLHDAASHVPAYTLADGETICWLGTRRPACSPDDNRPCHVRKGRERSERRPDGRRERDGERCRHHAPGRSRWHGRAHNRSLDLAEIELGDVGLGAP